MIDAISQLAFDEAIEQYISVQDNRIYLEDGREMVIQLMGKTLARRLGKAFHFGMVVTEDRDPHFAQIDITYVLWSEIQSELQEIVS